MLRRNKTPRHEETLVEKLERQAPFALSLSKGFPRRLENKEGLRQAQPERSTARQPFPGA
jgi:hypothetical protein